VGILVSVHLKGPSSPIRLIAHKVEHDLESLRFSRDGIEIARFMTSDVDTWLIEDPLSDDSVPAAARATHRSFLE
jgi:hypothetical protein